MKTGNPLSRISRVVESVRRFERLKSDDQSDDVKWAFTYLSLLTSEYQKFRYELIERKVEKGEKPEWEILARLEMLIDHAFAVGAFTEDKAATRKAASQKSRGGKKGAKFHIARKKNWQGKALPLLKKLQPKGQAPVFTDFGLANELRRLHATEIAGLPSTSSPVVAFIKELVEKGDLAPSKADRRRGGNVKSTS